MGGDNGHGGGGGHHGLDVSLSSFKASPTRAGAVSLAPREVNPVMGNVKCDKVFCK